MSAEHTIEDCRAAVEAWEAAQPIYLGCGCLEGVHDNTMEALHEAHPDVLGWEHTGSFYGTTTLVIDPVKLGEIVERMLHEKDGTW